jgi:hypothetical protein
MALPDGAASVWPVATRIAQLDQFGNPDVGALAFVTDQIAKITMTPVMETGDDIAIKNAAGNLVVRAKHGDMPKYYTCGIDLITPDPDLTQILSGGAVLADSSAALGTPTFAAPAGQTTLGSLPAGTYGYRVSQYSIYGESTAAAEQTASVASGTTGTVVVGGVTFAAAALGARVYGRAQGQEQLLGTIPNVGTQATSAVSGTGTVTSLSVTSLTKSLPKGMTFTIAGDTNTPKIVFTTSAAVGVGAVSVPVTASQSVTITIAAGNIVPVFVDNGTVTPSGLVPGSDTSAGPGAHAGYQAGALGAVQNPNGVSLEIWSEAIWNGGQAPLYPYFREVYPWVRGLHATGAMTYQNNNRENAFEGQAFENPNWGSGPFADWPLDSTKVRQQLRVGATALPPVGFQAVPQTA